MPHLKCETCRTRFHTDARRLSDVREVRCPACDSPLEAPSQLTELVGFQRSRLDSADDNSDFLTAVAIALNPPGSER